MWVIKYCGAIDTIYMTEKELNNIYVTNLRKIRVEIGLSQSDLSEQIGITEKYYNTIENGKKWGSFATLVKLANALNIEPYELLLPNASLGKSLDKNKTQVLMKQLRNNLNELVNTVEKFLAE